MAGRSQEIDIASARRQDYLRRRPRMSDLTQYAQARAARDPQFADGLETATPTSKSALLAATLAVPPSTQPLMAEDPCLLAKRVAQSPPCFAESPCQAEALWREAFGAPRLRSAGLTALPFEVAARLPKTEQLR
jgi:hypothetical protein